MIVINRFTSFWFSQLHYQPDDGPCFEKLMQAAALLADPEFSRRGGAPTYYSANFPRKLRENERNWIGGGGACPWRSPLYPPSQ